MKNKHELPNGTVLEVGNKYIGNDWVDGQWIEVLYLGEKRVFYKDYRCAEFSSSYKSPILKNLIPYTEPKKKIKVAKYAYYSIDKWFESNSFFKSDAEFKHRYGAYSKFIRLTHTEIEVDEY